MPAYLIADVEVMDPAVFEEYRALVPSTVQQYGGRFLVRGGTVEVLEGERRPHRLVVLEFPSVEQARRWYDSEEYRRPKGIRFRSARTELFLAEGVSA
jgi:uncharacterized protein (DUF1330 family)